MPRNPFLGKWQIFGLYSIEFLVLLVLHPRTARLMDERAEKVGLLTHITASSAGSFKLLRNPGIDSKESTPPASAA
jgi:hypothetical protein